MFPGFALVEKLCITLFDIDRRIASEMQAQRCHCGGKLHVANYFRKPRGIDQKLPRRFCIRFSFCCAICRKRSMPDSVRFAGRAVYLKCWIVWIGLLQALNSLERVKSRHAARIANWWKHGFSQTNWWREQQHWFIGFDDNRNSLLAALGSFWHRSTGMTQGFLKFLRFFNVTPRILSTVY